MTELAELELPRKDAITSDREESKFVLPRSAVESFVCELGTRLTRHQFAGDAARAGSESLHFATTVYFDTPSHAVLRAAVEDVEHNIKLRAREYYDVHDDSPGPASRREPYAFFELKRRNGARTQKARCRFAKREAFALLSGSHPVYQRPAEELAPDLAQIVAYCRSLAQPLVPSVVVNYQRLAFQDELGGLRLTVDLDIGFYRPPADLWQRDEALERGMLGLATRLEPDAVVEVKCRGERAAWLAELFARTPLEPTKYSKFVHAGRAVHGLSLTA